MAEPFLPAPQLEAPKLTGIDPASAAEAYRSRGLATLSDARLFQVAGNAIAQPLENRLTNFTLHAPLELLARWGLMGLVDPADRELARIQVVASAAAYEQSVSDSFLARLPEAYPGIGEAEKSITAYLKKGDVEQAESSSLRIARQFGLTAMVRILGPYALRTMTTTSHAHIGFWLLGRYGMPGFGVAGANLMRASVRMIASEPKAMIKSFSQNATNRGDPLPMTAREVEAFIYQRLALPPAIPTAETGIRSLVKAAEDASLPDQLFSSMMNHHLSDEQIDAAFRALLRLSAHAMLQETNQRAKFGWTHHLTMPQAAWGLASLYNAPRTALAAALVWVTAWRSTMNVTYKKIDPKWAPERVNMSFDKALTESPEAAAAHVWHAPPAERPQIVRKLATKAAVRNDQHLVKYVLACLETAAFDPTMEHLYLAAAAYLLAVWLPDTPRHLIEKNLTRGRKTLGRPSRNSGGREP
ncbi:MAG: hypothetical protein QNK37_30665 [Acidobacteriota bacterium]|nr:hypothetical protein [Acidobacteriota bacterium]